MKSASRSRSCCTTAAGARANLAAELPAPNTFRLSDVGDMPVIVTRDADVLAGVRFATLVLDEADRLLDMGERLLATLMPGPAKRADKGERHKNEAERHRAAPPGWFAKAVGTSDFHNLRVGPPE